MNEVDTAFNGNIFKNNVRNNPKYFSNFNAFSARVLFQFVN